MLFGGCGWAHWINHINGNSLQKSNQFALVFGTSKCLTYLEYTSNLLHPYRMQMNAICGAQSHRDYIWCEQRLKLNSYYRAVQYYNAIPGTFLSFVSFFLCVCWSTRQCLLNHFSIPFDFDRNNINPIIRCCICYYINLLKLIQICHSIDQSHIRLRCCIRWQTITLKR